MTETRGGAPAESDASRAKSGVGSGSVEPHVSYEESQYDIVEYRQTALSEFPPSEEWFEDNIKDMDQAEAFGRILLEIDKRNKETLGLLFIHVEKHKGGRGLKGGQSELARRLEMPRKSMLNYASYVRGKQKVGQFGQLSEELPLEHYKLIDSVEEPEKTIEFIAEKIEENRTDPKKRTIPTIREVEKKNREIVREKKLEELGELPTREDIVHGSIEHIQHYLEPDSVDLILTDPPYPEEYLPLWGVLAENAAKILRPGGFLVSYSPHIHLPKVIEYLSTHLQYVWTLVLLHNGATKAVHPRRIHAGWKPILVYCKPPYTPQDEYMDDVIQGTGKEKDRHEWQQALGEAEELITRFSRPKDFVVDPFLGSGTTVLAAQNTGRNFFGMDIDELAVKTTLRRLKE